MTGPGVEVVVALWLVALGVLLVSWVLAGLPGVVVVVVVLAASYSPGAQALECRMQQGDSLQWKGDKRAHAAWTGLGAAGVVAADAALDLELTPLQQWGVAMVPGLLRELRTACSSDPRGGFSWQDVVYNGLGAAVGVGVGNGVRVLLTPRSLYIYKEW